MSRDLSRPWRVGAMLLVLLVARSQDRSSAPVRTILSERYPNDRAAACEAGELLGAISVRIPVAEPCAGSRWPLSAASNRARCSRLGA